MNNTSNIKNIYGGELGLFQSFIKGSEICKNNYRPISLLSVFNRIMEKIVYKGLIQFIDHHNIVHANQFGFRSKHSTLHAIKSITDKLQKAIEKGFYS